MAEEVGVGNDVENDECGAARRTSSGLLLVGGGGGGLLVKEHGYHKTQR